MKKSRIMIVEDEESLLKLESILLSAKGYCVTGVMDGESALEEISAQKPDWWFLDIMLPRLDGFEYADRSRKTPKPALFPWSC